MNLFDRQLGVGFFDSIPVTPGIYKIFNLANELIYVGKAKNLRRRLGQYRNAKRRKKHQKMKRIISEAHRIELEVCQSEWDAVLRETEIIQLKRPKWNVAGAFYFLYPLVGMKVCQGSTFFCYTTEPGYFSSMELHGAFRSRYRSREAFFAATHLMPYLCHPISRARSQKIALECGLISQGIPKFSYLYGFRQMSAEWHLAWTQFWKGESRAVLEELILALVENAGARRRTNEVQEHLHALNRFWRYEAQPLAKARNFNQYLLYPVDQKDRDLLFLKYRGSAATQFQHRSGGHHRVHRLRSETQ